MRIKRKQIIVTTVVDREVSLPEDIKQILSSIAKGSVDVMVEYRDPSNDYVKRHEKCRIKEVFDDRVSIKIFQQGGQFSANNIPFENILTVEMVTEKKNIIANKKDMTRFDLMDIPCMTENKDAADNTKSAEDKIAIEDPRG